MEKTTKEIVQTVPDLRQEKSSTKKMHFNMESALKIFSNVALQISPEFVIDEVNRKVIIKLLQYFHSSPLFEHNSNGKYKLNKGLFIRGNVGTGKSLLLQIFSKYISETISIRSKRFKKIQSYKIGPAFSQEGYNALIKYNTPTIGDRWGYTSDIYQPNHLLIDDLGLEAVKSYYYKIETDIVSELLLNRYDLFRDNGVFTHVTTNLSPKLIKERYQDRIFSRFKEMFNDIILDGPDRRK